MIENIDNNIVRVRFPNESYYDTIHNFKWNEFKEEKYFPECVFGWYEDVYVCVNRDDYDNAKNNR
jgi:hypothetical protein